MGACFSKKSRQPQQQLTRLKDAQHAPDSSQPIELTDIIIQKQQEPQIQIQQEILEEESNQSNSISNQEKTNPQISIIIVQKLDQKEEKEEEEVKEVKEAEEEDEDTDNDEEEELPKTQIVKQVNYLQSKSTIRVVTQSTNVPTTTIKINNQLTKNNTQVLLSKPCKILKVDNIKQIEAAIEKSNFIYYDNKIIHSGLLKQYSEVYNQNYEKIIQQVASKQTIIYTKERQAKPFNDGIQVKNYISSISKLFPNVLEVKELARGGQAVVYWIEHTGTDEIVARCPLFSENASPDELINGYNAIIYETQTLQICPLQSSIAQIKEEIIEYNKELGIISRHCVIMEQAQYSLTNLIKIWNSEIESKRLREWFTSDKLANYFFQAMCAVQYLHQNNIYYGDMKEDNLLVFRSQQVKLGDFGTIIKMDDKDEDESEEKYILKAFTPGYITNNIKDQIEAGCQVSRIDLMENDKYALLKTFQQSAKLVQTLAQKDQKTDNKLEYLEMIEDIDNNDLLTVIQIWAAKLAVNYKFIDKLAAQLKHENKLTAMYNVYSLSKYRIQLDYLWMQGQKESQDTNQNKLIIPNESSYLVPLNLVQVKYKCDDMNSIIIKDPFFKQLCCDIIIGLNLIKDEKLKEFIFKSSRCSFELGDYNEIKFSWVDVCSGYNDYSLLSQEYLQHILSGSPEFISVLDFYISYFNRQTGWNPYNIRMIFLPIYQMIKKTKHVDIIDKLQLHLMNLLQRSKHIEGLDELFKVDLKATHKQEYLIKSQIYLSLQKKRDQKEECLKYINNCEYTVKQDGESTLLIALWYQAKAHYFYLIKNIQESYKYEQLVLEIYLALLGRGAAETIDTYNRLADLALELILMDQSVYYAKKYTQSYQQTSYAPKQQQQLGLDNYKELTKFSHKFSILSIIQQVGAFNQEPSQFQKSENQLVKMLHILNDGDVIFYGQFCEKKNEIYGNGILLQKDKDKEIIIEGYFDNQMAINFKGRQIIQEFGYRTSQEMQIYTGELKNGQPHGYGEIIYDFKMDLEEGQLQKINYQGQWASGIRQGWGLGFLGDGEGGEAFFEGWWDKNEPKEGALTHKSGSRYIGSLQNFQRNGKGMSIFKGGQKYEGEFKNDMKDGQGIIYFESGDTLNGKFKNDKACGHCIYTWSNGGKYVGEWRDDQKNGYGVYTQSNGYKYEGYYKDGKQHGTGTQSEADGSIYTGQFYNNQRHGKGIQQMGDDGSRYEGEWKNNKRHGQGVSTWSDGSKYIGSMYDDMQSGYGVFKYLDGSRYEGEWKEHQKHGHGKLFNTDGKIQIEGEYIHGQIQGQATHYQSDGSKYIGQWYNNKKHGRGVFVDKNGKQREGEWAFDQQIRWLDENY